jgi:lipopolysaccharide transport system ATP-binding protein
MPDAILATNVSKYYRLGAGRRGKYGTLRESVMDVVGAPVHRVRRLFHRRGSDPGAENAPSGTNGRAGLWALKEISLKIQPGEAVGIIGRNGAGKSTLLKVLSRITPPSDGSIEVRGRLGSLLEVGTGFHPELTGRENIFLNGAIMGMPRREIRRKFGQIVDFAEVDRFIDTPVKRYSSGMYVKLAFSVAAHMEPDILLIDEVLSVGDLAFQRKCLDYTRRLLQRNVTLLFVSHNMFVVKALCDRCICLDQGRVQADGATEDVTSGYDQQSRLDVAGWAKAMVGADPTRCPIFITAVDVLDKHGRPRRMFEHGQRMRVRLQYRATHPVADPNFCVALIRSDNVACCNFSSALDKFATGKVVGEGTIELAIPPLKLVADLYSLQVLVWDASFKRLHCAQTGPDFHVRDPLLSTEFGVFHEAAEWAMPKRALGVSTQT